MANQSKGMKAAEALSDFVNSANSRDKADFVKAVLSDHSELQSQMFFLVRDTIDSWAKRGEQEEKISDAGYDVRLQGVHKQSLGMYRGLVASEKGLTIPLTPHEETMSRLKEILLDPNIHEAYAQHCREERLEKEMAEPYRTTTVMFKK